jgi:UDP-glucose 4-epimerase
METDCHGKRILLTGGNGFLGHAILHELLEGKALVTLGGRTPPRDWEGEFLRFDLADHSSVTRAFSGSQEFDVVIHAAGTLKAESLRINHEGTRSLLEAVGTRTDRWIQLSSAGVYKNNFWSVVREDAVCEQITDYERSKWLADQEVMARHSDYVLLRPTMVAGLGMKGSPLRLFAQGLRYGMLPAVNENSLLNLVHVRDVAAAVLHCCEYPPTGSRELILSDDLPLREVLLILSTHQKNPPLRVPDFFLKAAAYLGSALGSSVFDRRRYAILNNEAEFLSDKMRSLMKGWPFVGARAAVEEFRDAFQEK